MCSPHNVHTSTHYHHLLGVKIQQRNLRTGLRRGCKWRGMSVRCVVKREGRRQRDACRQHTRFGTSSLRRLKGPGTGAPAVLRPCSRTEGERLECLCEMLTALADTEFSIKFNRGIAFCFPHAVKNGLYKNLPCKPRKKLQYKCTVLVLY